MNYQVPASLVGRELTSSSDFNDGLEQLFPPSRVPSIHRVWQHELLASAQRDLSELSLLEGASSDTYPQLNASATLKKLRINLDAKPQASFKPTFAFRVPYASLNIQDPSDPRRSPATNRDGTDVLVEWVPYDAEAKREEEALHLRRLDDLARMMHCASDTHPDLHTVDCLGYTDDAERSRYGLVFRIPRQQQPSNVATFSPLYDVIASPDLKTPELGARVRLAHTLAVALWSLHSLDWLHKGLCSHNILFFPSDEPSPSPPPPPLLRGAKPSSSSTDLLSPTPGGPNNNQHHRRLSSSTPTGTASPSAVVADISSPYLVGFEASRPDLDVEVSSVVRRGGGAGFPGTSGAAAGFAAPPDPTALHRHPRAGRTAYRKAYDVYALGMVLLEIGLWQTIARYHKPRYTPEHWRDKVVLNVLVPGLDAKIGRLYREVVEKCLRVGDEVDGEEIGRVMEEVVAGLEGIRV